MKTLALYVDKWYIVGTHCGNGNPQPLRIPNGDDRIWLYFYNDREANRVSYSLKYKEKALSEIIDYYTDIFKLIPANVGATYKRFGRNVEIRTIFDAAGIFDDLREKDDEKIKVYISFSSDISYQAQSVFLSLMEEKGFDVEEYVARIGHLAIEYAYRHKLIANCRYIFVANACNENLRFALYEQFEELFVCRKECLYEGLGIDLRRRAILEDVVENLESASRFVCSEEEKKEEFNFLGQYVDGWIKKLDENDGGVYMPTSLGNLHFKKQQGNSYPVSVMRSEIDERTSVIIDDIVGAMLRMLSEYGISVHNLTHILFLGNSFENSLFKNRLIKQSSLDDSRIIHFRENQLSEIVSVYAEINCGQFKDAEDQHRKLSEAEKVQAEQAKQEREAMAEAQKKEAEEIAIRNEERQKKKALEDAIEYAQRAERSEKYEDALAFYQDALALDPQNQQVQNKVENLKEVISDKRSKKKQFDEYIENAKQYIDDKNWDGAIVQSQMALGVMPQSDEAKQILNRAKDMSNRYVRLKECLTQTDFFIGEGAFDKALEELRHAELLELNDAGIEKRREIILTKQKVLKEQIDTEKEKLNNYIESRDYDKAIASSETLASMDSKNQNVWSKKRLEVLALQKEEHEKEEQWNRLVKDIESARWDENLEEIVSLCNKALEIKEDETIKKLLEKAKQKLKEEQIKEYVEKAQKAESIGAYGKSIELVKEALTVEPQNEMLKKYLTKYTKRINNLLSEINHLVKEMQSKERIFDFRSAIDLCNQLIEIDTENTKKWNENMQRLQALQIDKSDLEINFRRKKADLNVVIRGGDIKEAERRIIDMRKKYWEYGIKSHDGEFEKMLDSLHPEILKPQPEDKTSEISKTGKNATSKKGKGAQSTSKKEETTDCKNENKTKSSQTEISQNGQKEKNATNGEGFRLLRSKQYMKAKRVFALEGNSNMSSICTDFIKLEKAKSQGILTPKQAEELEELYNEYNIS